MNFREQQEYLESKLLSQRAKKSVDAKRWKRDTVDLFRTDYQRDVARILYSDAFRRLSHKTQVFVTKETDQHSRTRITHTMEVCHIAKSIAQPLELNCDLVEAIALGHDLGHTPYGHAGEYVLNEKMKKAGKSFNHNVQSVWILQKNFYKRKDSNKKTYPGLNLTYDVLEGIWKHTKTKGQLTEYEESLSKLSPENIGSFEAQVVNKADSIAYNFHDIKDAVRNKIISIEEFKNDVWQKYFDVSFDPENWINHFIIDLIQNNKNTDEIKFSEPIHNAYEGIRSYLYEKVIKSEKIKKMDNECKEKISTIYDYYNDNIDILLDKNGLSNKMKCDKYGQERVIVDYIQWLGDANAENEYLKIKKTKLQYNTR